MSAKIVLVLMVKNEAERIERVLKSALPHVDAVLVFDTGSRDGTVEKATELLRNVSTHWRVYPEIGWEGFGQTRTWCFQKTRLWLQDEEIPWYALLLDGDHELIAPIDRTKLTEPAHCLYQRDEVRTYKNVRLIRLDTDAKCIGRTHEVWNVTGSAVDSADKPSIYDHADGSNRAGKHERDLELLTQDLEDPTVSKARTYFYLGQTYQEMGSWGKAYDQYAKRLQETDDNPEDRWMAKYRQAQCLQIGQKFSAVDPPITIDDVVSAYWEAYNARPHRAEPLCALAHLYLDQGNNLAAYNLAKWCLDIPYPKDDYLFIDDAVYTWSPHDVLAIASHYLGKTEQGQESAEIVIRTENRTAAFYWKALQTLSYYVPVAESEWSISSDPRYTEGLLIIPETLRTFDGVVYEQSTMCHTDNYEVVRLVNYDHDRGNSFVPKEGEKIRTQNAFRARGGEWQILKLDPYSVGQLVPAKIEGLEDIRILEGQGTLWFTATTCQLKRAEGRSQMVFGHIRNGEARFGHVGYQGIQEYEKNWLPLKTVKSGDDDNPENLRVIYSYDPLIILEVESSGNAWEVTRLPSRFAGLRFRGGTSPVAIGGGDYLAMVHEVGVRTKGDTVCERIYMHRWLRFNEKEGVTAYSDAFCLDHVGVEYAAGLRMQDGNLEVSYGREERATCVVAYDLKKVLNSLK